MNALANPEWINRFEAYLKVVLFGKVIDAETRGKWEGAG